MTCNSITVSYWDNNRLWTLNEKSEQPLLQVVYGIEKEKQFCWHEKPMPILPSSLPDSVAISNGVAGYITNKDGMSLLFDQTRETLYFGERNESSPLLFQYVVGDSCALFFMSTDRRIRYMLTMCNQQNVCLKQVKDITFEGKTYVHWQLKPARSQMITFDVTTRIRSDGGVKEEVSVSVSEIIVSSQV